MSSKDLFERLMEEPERPRDRPMRPSLALVGVIVRWERQLRQWKVTTLASFAGVSVSTVERVERGEVVTDEVLGKIAIAFGYASGRFWEPRIPLGRDAAVSQAVETYGDLVAVSVGEMTNEKAVREAASTDALVVHRPLLPAEYDRDVAILAELLDFISFQLSEVFASPASSPIPRRQLYAEVLGQIEDMRQRGVTVLSGVLTTEVRGFGDFKVAVVCISPKSVDPGAPKRRTMMLDRKMLAPENMTWDLPGQETEEGR